MVSTVTVNSRLTDTSLLRAPLNYWNVYTKPCVGMYNWTLKRIFLGVADYTCDDDDIAKVHRLIDCRPRLQNLDFDGLEYSHVNSLNFSHLLHGSESERNCFLRRWLKLRVDYGRRFVWVKVDNPDHSNIRDFRFKEENEFSWRFTIEKRLGTSAGI